VVFPDYTSGRFCTFSSGKIVSSIEPAVIRDFRIIIDDTGVLIFFRKIRCICSMIFLLSDGASVSVMKKTWPIALR